MSQKLPYKLEIKPVSYQVILKFGKINYEFRLINKEDGHIYNKLIFDCDLPEDYMEAKAQTDIPLLEPRSLIKEMLLHTDKILDEIYALTKNRPILWVCRTLDAKIFMLFNKKAKKYDFTILKGTLSEINNHPIIRDPRYASDYLDLTNGINEQILMLKKIP